MRTIKLTGNGGSEHYRLWKMEKLLEAHIFDVEFVDISDPLHPKVVYRMGHNSQDEFSKPSRITSVVSAAATLMSGWREVPTPSKVETMERVAERALNGYSGALSTMRKLDPEIREKLYQSVKLRKLEKSE